MKIIGVVGGGTMGKGIAQLLLLNDYYVILLGTSVKKNIEAVKIINSRIDDLLFQEKINANTLISAKNNLKTAVKIKDLINCDIIIEAITEDKQRKCALLKKMSLTLGDDVIIASNTSSLKIEDIARNYKIPGNVIGAHFFNPTTIVESVEVCSSIYTNKIVFNEICSFIKSLGKEVITVADDGGLVINRVGIPPFNKK